ncbi:MAG TPA: hypothetical protein VMH90_04320 [Thermoplasmata archaeon]|nr:hypothetical protein [Thermoplasmata archaeon]
MPGALSGTGTPVDLILFVSGGPPSGPDLQTIQYGRVTQRFFGALAVPGGWSPARPIGQDPSAEPPDDWRLPADAVMCVEVVESEARRVHREVRVVDVNRPGDDRPLVEQWITPSDVLPLLLDPSGRRLEGVENFQRAAVRAFLRSPLGPRA